MTLEFLAIEPLAKGVAIGLAVAVPVGPSCILCLQRAICCGSAAGIVTGFGIATVHGVYALIAALSAQAAVEHLAHHALILKLCAALMLFWLSARAYSKSIVLPRFEASPTIAPLSAPRLVANYGSALLLGAANPITMIFFAAALPTAFSSSAGASGAEVQLAPTVLGVVAGSAIWWLTLNAGAAWLRETILRTGRLAAVNLVMALALAGTGCLLVASDIGRLMYDAPKLPVSSR